MSAPYDQIMVDIETMGASRDAAVLSIGAVPFSLAEDRLEVGPRETWFHRGCSLANNIADGRSVDGDTVEWWLGQSEEAREALLEVTREGDTHGLAMAFRRWWEEVSGGVESDRCRVWAKPPSFDVEILGHLLGSHQMALPWHWRRVGDVRTILRVAREIGVDSRPGWGFVAHNAVDDAAMQACQVVETYRALRELKAGVVAGGAA